MGKESEGHDPLIEICGVTRVFDGDGAGEVAALIDVSLCIDAGEFVCITGPSGSGKSTLLNLLGCLDRPTAGSYRFAGRDVAEFTADDLALLRRKAFGFVFQDYGLLDSVTAQANVEMPVTYTGLDGRQRRDRARQLLTAFEMGDRVAHRPSELSGGEQQRVSIARALVNGAQVVFADEPTGALDSEQGAEVMALLKQLAQRGHAIVVVSHDPGMAAQATRRIELQDGRLVDDTRIADDTLAPAPDAKSRERAAVTTPEAAPPRPGSAAAINAIASLRTGRNETYWKSKL